MESQLAPADRKRPASRSKASHMARIQTRLEHETRGRRAGRRCWLAYTGRRLYRIPDCLVLPPRWRAGMAFGRAQSVLARPAHRSDCGPGRRSRTDRQRPRERSGLRYQCRPRRIHVYSLMYCTCAERMYSYVLGYAMRPCALHLARRALSCVIAVAASVASTTAAPCAPSTFTPPT